MKTSFVRGNRTKLEATDNRGNVQVSVALRAKKGFLKGNSIRSLTVRDAKVSEVFEAIESSLFDGAKPRRVKR